MTKIKGKRAAPVQFDLFGNPIENRRTDVELLPFHFGGNRVRVIKIKGEPWWVLADVARILEYRDAEQAKRLLRPKHWGTTLNGTPEIQPGMLIVNEAGLYRLMMRSEKPEAERFQDWITDEVLPAIRKTGAYSLPDKGSLVAKFQKRLNSDVGTAKERVDSFHLNKGMHGKLAAEGAKPRDFQDIHNTWYIEIAGIKAPELRKLLGQRYWETPLDRFSQIVLSQRNHAVAMLEKQVEDLARTGVQLSMKQRKDLFIGIVREVKACDLRQLGADFDYGVINHERRGLIVDLIRRQIPAA